MLEASERDIKRFMSKVDILPNGCWLWTGGRSRGKGNSKWYGSFSLNGKTIRAHRFSSEVLNKHKCPPGHHRDHTCDFSMCVCPDHIEVVTHEENQARKVAGRGSHWVCPCKKTVIFKPMTRDEANAHRKAIGGLPICDDCDGHNGQWDCTMNCGPARGVNYWPEDQSA